MRNRVLMSLLVIALAAALVGGATMAWFTDAAETETVDFQAGTLLINVDKLGDAEAANDTEFATLERLNPGDCWKWEFDVHNQGTKSANWLLYLCYQEETGLENLGEDAFGDREGFGTGRLSEVLKWTVEVEGDGVIYDGLNILEAPHVFDNVTAFGVPGEEGVKDSKHVTVTACLPGKDTGNEYQGAKMEIAFGVHAWQTTNGAEFEGEIVCPFDNNGGDNDEPIDEPGDPVLDGYNVQIQSATAALEGEWGTEKTRFIVKGKITLNDQFGNVHNFTGDKVVLVRATEALYGHETTVYFENGIAEFEAEWMVGGVTATNDLNGSPISIWADAVLN